MRRRNGLRVLGILALLAAAAPAHAHKIRISRLAVDIGDTEIRLYAPLVPIEVLADTPPAVAYWEATGGMPETSVAEAFRYFDEKTILTESGARLAFVGETAALARLTPESLEQLRGGGIVRESPDGALAPLDHLVVFGRFPRATTRGGAPGRLELDAGRLFAEMGEYPPIPIAEIRGPGYKEIHPFDGFANWHEPPPLTPWLRFWRGAAFVGTGIWHIFTGYDHILFLLGLHLVSPSFKETLKIVTAFTISHSITLALAATGVFSLSPRLVEPLIALTIIYVGIENLWRPHPTGRWITAFFFGFIHGFGFAGALGESLNIQDLGRWAFGVGLLSFNVGVEIGQAAVVGALAPFWVGVRWIPARARIIRAGSIAISCIGLYWFVARTFG